MASFTDLYDPLRSPNWRAERVHEILRSGPHRLPSRITDDQAVWRLFRFSKLWQSANTEQARRLAKLSDPEVWMAYRLQRDPSFGGRALVEARILAGQTDQEIAERSGTLTGAISLFEQLYFNVRDRLQARDWILRCIFGPDLDFGLDSVEHLTSTQLDTVYRLFGYFGGPAVIDYISCGYFEAEQPAHGSQVPGWIQKAASGLIHRRSLLAASTLRINRYNAVDLINTSIRLLELEQKERAQEGASDAPQMTLRQTARQIFEKIGKMIGAESSKQRLPQRMQEYWESAMEPRLKDWVDQMEPEKQTELAQLAKIDPFQVTEPSGADAEHGVSTTANS